MSDNFAAFAYAQGFNAGIKCAPDPDARAQRIADAIEAYADANHRCVSPYGYCAPAQGDRCDITAAIHHTARIARETR